MKKLTDKAKKAINEAIKEESSLLGCGIEKIEDIEKAQAVVLRERETSLNQKDIRRINDLMEGKNDE